jgi:hypothetical protein
LTINRVVVEPQANTSKVIDVDLVLVKDKKMVAQIAEMSSVEWFEGWQGVKGVERKHWEWSPDQTVVGPLEFTYSGKGRAAFLFARYWTREPSRAIRIDPMKRFTLHLGLKEPFVMEAK